MKQLFANNASALVGVAIGTGDVSITVASQTNIPSPSAAFSYFKARIRKSNTGASEIVHVTAVSGATWTITRAQEGTSALAFDIGDTITLTITAGSVAAPEVVSRATDPGTSDVTAGTWVVWKNTTVPETRIWFNDSGVMKKSAAFT